MCAICGFYSPTWARFDVRKFVFMCEQSLERGRDGFGFAISDGRRVYVKKYTNMENIRVKINYDIPRICSKIHPLWGIANARAEPTTEYVENKDEDATQPFSSCGVYVVHNGTIANDKYLIEKYELEGIKYGIDTEVFTKYLGYYWDGSFKDLIRILKYEITGSYALAIGLNEKLYLATNYKPLYLMQMEGAYYFASLRHHLTWYDYEKTFKNLNQVRFERCYVEEVKPYTALEFDLTSVNEQRLWIKDDIRRVMVIASGGLDSTTVATKYVREGKDVTMLHVLYGCRAEDRERQAVEKIADYLGCKLEFMDLTGVYKQIGHSSLLKDDAVIVDGESGAEFAHEWVPCRNLVMLSISAALAEANNIDVIALGNNLEESGAYPDNEWIFTHKFGQLLPHATNLQNRVRVEMPLGNLMKHEIVKLGLELGTPYHLTWSCYNGESKHCGNCGPCYMRAKAFKINGVIDPVLEHLGPEFWKGCKPFTEVLK